MPSMRRRLAGLLCMCACFSESDTGGSGDGADGSGSSGSGSTTASTSTSSADATTTISTTGTSDTLATTTEASTGDPTEGACTEGVLVPPHPGWTGPVAVRPGAGPLVDPCPDGLLEADSGVPDPGMATCECHCTGGPSQLCAIQIGQGELDCGNEGPFLMQDCAPVLPQTAHLQASVGSTTCIPDAATPQLAGDAQTVQACQLPAMNGCAVVPEGFDGPCVMGGAGDCPDGYQPRGGFDTVDGCAGCQGCDTAGYCASVVATIYSDLMCTDNVDTLPIDQQCHNNFMGPVVAVGFAAAGEPQCTPAMPVTTHVNVCCMP
jgi:hypothetical protein